MRGAARWMLAALLVVTGFAASAQEVVRYVHTDALGSPVAESDEAGNIVARYDYEPYGAAIGQGPQDGPGFTGHVSDSATGLTYMQQRYYDPEVGAFLSVDPVATISNSIEGFNLYRYANGNPYTFIDPDGRQACGQNTTCRLAQGAAGGTIGVVPKANNSGGGDSRVATQSTSPGGRWDDVKGRLGLKGDLTKNGNIFDIKSLAFDVFVPLSESPGGSGVKAAGLGAFMLAVRMDSKVVFQTSHYATRLEAEGLNVVRTEAVVAREVARIHAIMPPGAGAGGRLKVNGVLIEYRVRHLPDGRYSVGTIFPVKVP